MNWQLHLIHSTHFYFLSEESFGSSVDSDVEDAGSEEKRNELSKAPASLLAYDPSIDMQLPQTVSLLTTPDGGKVYVVGTAHFSMESQEDVAKVSCIR
jgi:hypothetical protein